MAATTRRVTFTKTKVFTFTVDFPNYSAVTDANILAAAKLPNGACALGELLAGSAANNGAISNQDTVSAPSSAWAVSGTGSNIEPYFMWTASTALVLGDRITPTVPTSKLYQVTTAGTTGATEGTTTSGNATAMVVGGVYKINVVGTTDFTLCGALSNAVGTIFAATKAGVGTGTVYTVWPASGIVTNGTVVFTAISKF